MKDASVLSVLVELNQLFAQARMTGRVSGVSTSIRITRAAAAAFREARNSCRRARSDNPHESI